FRQYGYDRDTIERAVGRGPAAGKHEERSAPAVATWIEHFAYVGFALRGGLQGEKITVSGIEIRRCLRELAGHQRIAFPINEKDGTQLGKRIDDILQSCL